MSEQIDKTPPRVVGKIAEENACTFLQNQGLILIQKNYFCRFGEIDLIMEQDSVIIFVEVKFRHNNNYGSGFDSITPTKIKKILIAANFYLLQHPRYRNYNCRFDVVAINGVKNNNTTSSNKLQWITNAFEA